MMQAQMGDIQFYLLKIARLQSDLGATQNQLMNARLRLRTAEDYQIKYQLLLKQSEQQAQRVRLFQREEQSKIAELITIKIEDRDIYWSDKLAKSQRQTIEKYTKQINKISEQFANFRKKHEKCGTKFDDQDLMAFKNKKLQKQNEALQQKIAEMKNQFERIREQQQKQIKQSMQQRSKQRQQNQRKIYREKIQSLELTIRNLQDNLIEAKAKADPQRQKQIQKLKSQLTTQISRSNEQINKISLGFNNKNKQIEDILNSKIKIEEALINQKKQLKDYIKGLQDKLFQRQRQHEIQLINLKQRMSKIRQQQSETLKQQMFKIQQNFKQQQNSWKIILEDKDHQIQRIKNKCDSDTQRHKQDRAKQIKKIQQLKQRLKEYEGQRQAGQTQNLINSMKQMESKQENFNNYENGVTFLDRQLKKAMSKIEQKNIQITKLLKQLNQLRKENQQELNSQKQKNRRDKKYYGDKIMQLEHEIKELNQETRQRQRQHKKIQRDLEAKITQLNKQNASLKQMVQEMQRDYTRVVETKKGLQSSYREQRQKGLTSKSDLTMVKKQKWLQMQRQKSQLQAIFKQKQEQLRNRHEIQTEKLRNQRDQLLVQNSSLKGLLQSSNKKQGDEDKQNKRGVYTEFHKKMATLNLQIALTKNIYDSLVQAKSRKSKQSKVSQFDKIDEDQSHSDQIQMQLAHSQLRDSRPPQFPNSSLEKMGLTMSFNPNKK